MSIFEKKENRLVQCMIKLPAALFLIVWPLTVHFETVRTYLEGQKWYGDITYAYDIFMHVRSKGLLALTIWMLVATVIILLDKKRNVPWVSVGIVGAYMLMVVISAIRSVDRNISFHGMIEQYETVWVLLSYTVIFLYFALTWQRYIMLGDLLGYILCAVGLQGVIGISQMLRHDFWGSSFGMKLILAMTGQSIQLNFYAVGDEQPQVYLSFYNPNYAAVYIILMMPFVACAIMYVSKMWQKICCSCLLALLVIVLIGTGSKTGWMALMLQMLLWGVFVYMYKNRIKIYLIGVLLLTIGIFVMIINVAYDSLPGRVKTLLLPEKISYTLTDLSNTEDGIRFTYEDKTCEIHVAQRNGKYGCYCLDDEGKQCRLMKDQEGHYILDEILESGVLSFSVAAGPDEQRIVLYCLNRSWEFIKTADDDMFYYLNPFGKKDTIQTAICAVDTGYEQNFTQRMYLWMRTLPLLKKYVMTGSGPDTFALVFPQNDYLYRYYAGDVMTTSVITRPHSFYLQQIVQTGGISLFLLLILIVRTLVYLANAFWDKRRMIESEENALRESACMYGMMLAILSFLFMGITNDSTVLYTPFLWMILGVGTAIHYKR